MTDEIPTETDTASGADFAAGLVEKAAVINETLGELVDSRTEILPHLRKAIKYTLDAPGKRVRAAIVLWSCEMVAGEIKPAAKTAAAAIEMVHTYSLVHDDLPAMDDDDTRRGQPTCHKAFDEPTAILTGDALLTLAFEVLAAHVEDPAVAVRLIKTLAKVAGPEGMIAGQMADLASENTEATLGVLKQIHMNKTAKMFAGAAAMGAVAGGANDDEIEHLLQFGLKLGLVFQIADDILDVSGTTEQLGKTAGKDAVQGKVTYPAVVGLDESRSIAVEMTDKAMLALYIFGKKADPLRGLAAALLDRTR